MKSLSGYIAEAAGKNTHMTHIEDLILDGGVKGARQAINALRSLRDMLSGNSKKSVDITVSGTALLQYLLVKTQEMVHSLLLRKVSLMPIQRFINNFKFENF